MDNYDPSADLSIIDNRKDQTIHDITNDYKKRTCVEFLHAKSKLPKTTKAAVVAKTIGTSMSTVNRTKKDLGAKSFYQYNIPTNYYKKSNPTRS